MIFQPSQGGPFTLKGRLLVRGNGLVLPGVRAVKSQSQPGRTFGAKTRGRQARSLPGGSEALMTVPPHCEDMLWRSKTVAKMLSYRNSSARYRVYDPGSRIQPEDISGPCAA